MTPAAQAKISVSAEDRFSQTFALLKKDLSDVSRQALGVGVSVASIGTAALAGFGVIKRFADDLDRLNDVADATGDSVENVSAVFDVVRRKGGDVEVATNALLRLNQELANAKPDSPAALALRQIGLDAAALRQQSPVEALQSIAVALDKYEDKQNGAYIVQTLFGKSTKEVAGVLKEMADAGELNRVVTREQALEAKLFNDQMNALSTNVGNAARSLVGDLLPALNASIRDLQTGRKEYAGFMEALIDQGLRVDPFKSINENLAATVSQYRAVRAEVDAITARQRDGGILAQVLSTSDDKRLATLREELRVLDARERTLRQSQLDGGAGAGRGRGGIESELRVVARLPGPEQSARIVRGIRDQVTEAERYLENLTRQGEKLQELSALDQARLDIEKQRIDGLTPALQAQILAQAEALDIAKRTADEKEREAAFQKIIAADSGRRKAAAISLLGDSDFLRVQDATAQIDLLRELLNDPAFQSPDWAAAIGIAIEDIKAKASGAGEQVKDDFDKISDAIEKSMDRSTDAILDFVVDGSSSLDDIWKAFSRDVLRQLVEDPVRTVMKGLVADIKKTFMELESGGDGGLFAGLGKLLSGKDGLFDTLGGFIGITSRANGGSVHAGDVVRLNENGIEAAVFGRDAMILSARQTRQAMQGGGQALYYQPTIHVNGDVSAQTVNLLRSMLDSNNVQLARSMRTGGGFAL